MEKPTLIGIHGAKGAGKDTTARFVKEWAAESKPALTAVRRGFADIPKWVFARQFFPRITQEEAVKWVDKYKNDPNYVITVDTHGRDRINIQLRQCMDQFATQGAREIYGEDFWVDQLLPVTRMFDENDLPAGMHWWNNFMANTVSVADICLVTDLRAENEVRRIKMLGGKCWKVKRREAEEAVEEEFKRLGREPHLFHTSLPDDLFDHIINNDDNDMDNARKRTTMAIRHTILGA